MEILLFLCIPVVCGIIGGVARRPWLGVAAPLAGITFPVMVIASVALSPGISQQDATSIELVFGFALPLCGSLTGFGFLFGLIYQKHRDFFQGEIPRGPFAPVDKHIGRTCMECGYDLRGLTEPRCPECGRPFERPH